MKFLCDHMLGSLATWLRLLGQDAAYPGPLGDTELIALAAKEERTLLTRDRELAGRAAGGLFVASDDLDEQLLEVSRAFNVPLELSPVRCSVCNGSLTGVPKADVEGKVPEKVFEQQSEFWHCVACDKHYWRGSHWARMEDRMRTLRSRSNGPDRGERTGP